MGWIGGGGGEGRDGPVRFGSAHLIYLEYALLLYVTVWWWAVNEYCIGGVWSVAATVIICSGDDFFCVVGFQ